MSDPRAGVNWGAGDRKNVVAGPGEAFTISGSSVPRRLFATGMWATYDMPASDTAGAPSASVLQLAPFPMDMAATFDRVAIEVTVTAASSTFRAGIYADTGRGVPGALVAELATFDTATATGVVTVTINLSLPVGLHWLGGVAQGGTPTLRARQGTGGYIQTMNANNANPTCYSLAGVTGALPANFGAVGTVNQGPVPKIMLRAA